MSAQLYPETKPIPASCKAAIAIFSGILIIGIGAFTSDSGIFVLGFLLAFVPLGFIAAIIGSFCAARALGYPALNFKARIILKVLWILTGVFWLGSVAFLFCGRGAQGSPF